MRVSDNLAKAFEDEVDKVCHVRMLMFTQKIATTHGIPLRLLMRDLPNPRGYCMGIKKGGEPCTRKASHGEYCMSHVNTVKLCEPVTINTTKRHNHSLPPSSRLGVPHVRNQKITNLEI